MLTDGVAAGSQETFFQIAATLIPILIFSGVVAERGGPQPEDSYRRIWFLAVGIPLFGTFAVMAEMVSISALVIGPRGGFWVGFVATTLAVGLVGVVVSVWLPWLAALRQKLPEVYRRLVLPAAALLSVAFVGTALNVFQSVDAANELERDEARVRTFKHRSMVHEQRIHRIERKLEGKVRKRERLRIQQRADTRTAADVAERLATAEAEGVPEAVLSIRRARVKYEAGIFRGDLEMDSRLDEEIVELFKDWDKELAALARLRP